MTFTIEDELAVDFNFNKVRIYYSADVIKSVDKSLFDGDEVLTGNTGILKRGESLKMGS